MDIKVLGIDLGKTACSLAGLDEAGAFVFRKRLQRHRLLDLLDKLPPCIVAMEACGVPHYIGRFCLQNGHEPRVELARRRAALAVKIGRQPDRPGLAADGDPAVDQRAGRCGSPVRPIGL